MTKIVKTLGKQCEITFELTSAFSHLMLHPDLLSPKRAFSIIRVIKREAQKPDVLTGMQAVSNFVAVVFGLRLVARNLCQASSPFADTVYKDTI
jgi:hypothetical protein